MADTPLSGSPSAQLADLVDHRDVLRADLFGARESYAELDAAGRLAPARVETLLSAADDLVAAEEELRTAQVTEQHPAVAGLASPTGLPRGRD